MEYVILLLGLIFLMFIIPVVIALRMDKTHERLDAENKELKELLKEALEWNWISHAEAVEEGNIDGQVPKYIVDRILRNLDDDETS